MKKVLIAIASCKAYEPTRKPACIGTWLKRLPSHVDYVFVIGCNNALYRDGDTLNVPCPDSYQALPSKTHWLMKWAATQDYDVVFKCDDDTYIHVPRLLEHIETTKVAYTGCPVYPTGFQYASGGAGYLLIKEAVACVGNNPPVNESFEDVYVGKLMANHGFEFVPNPRFSMYNTPRPSVDNNLITSHYCDAGWMEVINRSFIPNRIPKIFHHIWIGPSQFPSNFVAFRQTWIDRHPGWEFKLWTDHNLPHLKNWQAYRQAKNFAQKSDVLRYELLEQYGGIYVDTDFECLQPINCLLGGVNAFAAEQDDNIIAAGIIGAIPAHPIISSIVAAIPQRIATIQNQVYSAGPGCLTTFARAQPNFTIYSRRWFYPVYYNGHMWGNMNEAYANHHWAHSWK